MKNSSLAKSGTAVGLLFVVLYLLCLAWQYLLTDPSIQTLHVQLLMLTFPGFKAMTLGSMVWGGVLSFVYGWVGVALFRFTCKLSCGGSSEGSCCKK